jgi:predicted Zn-dependent peptidase
MQRIVSHLVETTTLANGLRVVTTSVADAPSVSVQLFIGVGSRWEGRERNGISHYLEHMVFKGTRRWPTAIELAEAIEGAGGQMNASTGTEVTSYWTHLPYDKLLLGMEVLAELVMAPLLDPEEVERERTVVQQEIRRAHDQPGARLGQLLAQACFGESPLGWPIAGTLETVQAIAREDLSAHLSAGYRPGNIVLSVAGPVSHEEVLAHAEALFGGMEGGLVATPFDPPPALPDRRSQVEQRPIQQCHLGLAVHALGRRDPDRHALTLLNTVLGRGMSSRLFKEVRERRGLAYSVGSSVSRYRDTGALSVSAGVSPEKAEETVRVLLHELLRLREEPVSEEELRKAKDYAIGSFLLGLESTRSRARRAGENLLLLGEVEPLEQVVGRLEAVTAEDVQRVARRLFAPERFAFAMVGPLADEGLLERAQAKGP